MRVRQWLTAATVVIAASGVSGQAPDRRLAPMPSANTERRLALVVGNNRYAAAPLQNAVADARAVAAALKGAGFSVALIEDGSRASLADAVAKLEETLRAEDVVFFYFAGHGIQLGGENYLIPV